jgi:DNA-binding PadR family transcriptional regulator
MSLRHAVLGLLSLQPSTGYELTQRFDRSLSNAWHASHSQIYPELSKLEAEGLVEVVAEGARRSKTWGATGAGREELRRWMTEAEPVRTQRNETGLRWFLVFLLEPADRHAVLEREWAYISHEARERREFTAQLDASGHTGGFRPVLDLAERMETVMIDWLREQADAAESQMN